MANFVMPVAFLTTLSVGVAVLWDVPHEQEPEGASFPTLAKTISPPRKSWMLTSASSHENCLLVQINNAVSKVPELKKNDRCRHVFRDSELVKFWEQDGEGNVLLTDAEGNAIVEFSRDEDGRLISTSGEPGALSLTPHS